MLLGIADIVLKYSQSKPEELWEAPESDGWKC
jgi:hypothetical protein